MYSRTNLDVITGFFMRILSRILSRIPSRIPTGRITKSVSVVMGIFILSGCSILQPPVPDVDVTATDNVEFMRPYELSRTDITIMSMGEVEGRSCQTSIFDNKPSQEDAIVLLKQAAADKDANRVVLRSCREEKTDDCRASWVCQGQAYQVQPLR